MARSLPLHCFDSAWSMAVGLIGKSLARSTLLIANFLAAMNPTAGSFTINPRLQRRFVAFAVDQPGAASLVTIFSTFLNGHLVDTCNFSEDVASMANNIIQAAIGSGGIHEQVSKAFRKSALNFHYEFNVRHLAGVFQGMLLSTPKNFNGSPSKFAQLFLHECTRVYSDRLISLEHVKKFRGILSGIARSKFGAFSADMSNLFAAEDPAPLIFCHFAQSTSQLEYDQALDLGVVTKVLEKALAEYNETNAAMPLVLFGDAVKHVARIARVLCATPLVTPCSSE